MLKEETHFFKNPRLRLANISFPRHSSSIMQSWKSSLAFDVTTLDKKLEYLLPNVSKYLTMITIIYYLKCLVFLETIFKSGNYRNQKKYDSNSNLISCLSSDPLIVWKSGLLWSHTARFRKIHTKFLNMGKSIKRFSASMACTELILIV